MNPPQNALRKVIIPIGANSGQARTEAANGTVPVLYLCCVERGKAPLAPSPGRQKQFSIIHFKT